jgi:ATPase subunit of ABC transporter with duplicated ATPase domains
LHQVTCQFATGETLFGPLNLSLENVLCGLVGRNGVGKTRLLRLLAGIDTPSGGHIERPVSLACVAQQHAITPQTTLAGLLGYGPYFAALQRLGRGEALADDVDCLEGCWNLPDRLSAGFREAGLADLIPSAPHHH